MPVCNVLQAAMTELMEHIRLPLISIDDLANVVQPTGIVSPQALMEAYQFQVQDEPDRDGVRFKHRSGLGNVLLPSFDSCCVSFEIDST